jgi:hypothetical protein
MFLNFWLKNVYEAKPMGLFQNIKKQRPSFLQTLLAPKSGFRNKLVSCSSKITIHSEKGLFGLQEK